MNMGWIVFIVLLILGGIYWFLWEVSSVMVQAEKISEEWE